MQRNFFMLVFFIVVIFLTCSAEASSYRTCRILVKIKNINIQTDTNSVELKLIFLGDTLSGNESIIEPYAYTHSCCGDKLFDELTITYKQVDLPIKIAELKEGDLVWLEGSYSDGLTSGGFSSQHSHRILGILETKDQVPTPQAVSKD